MLHAATFFVRFQAISVGAWAHVIARTALPDATARTSPSGKQMFAHQRVPVQDAQPAGVRRQHCGDKYSEYLSLHLKHQEHHRLRFRGGDAHLDRGSARSP